MSDTTEQTVPYSRLKAKVDAMKVLQAEHTALQEKLAELEPLAAKAEQLQADLTAEQGAHQATRSASEETLTLVSAGITDPEAQELVRFRRGKLGEDAPSLAEYLAGGAREDRFLSSLFEQPAQPAAPAAETAVQPVAEPVRTAPPVGDNAGTVPAPTPDGLGRLQEIQSKMSDPEWVAANKAAVLAELGF